MAAKRKYGNAEREAMFRLYAAGKTPAQIARLCAEGTAGTSPFTIPRRTVHQIVTDMAQEAEQKLPTSVAEAESAEAVERFPVLIEGIVKAEIDRLKAKQEKSGLSVGDYEKLDRASRLGLDLEKRLRRQQPVRRGRRGAAEGAGEAPEPKSAIEKLAEEEAKREREEAQPTSTHTHRNGDDSAAKTPDSAASDPPSAAPTSEDNRDAQAGGTAPAARAVHTSEPRPTPVSDEARQEAARKARAALAAG